MSTQVTAELHLLSSADGGRHGALPSNQWRTVLRVGGGNWSARLTFVGQPAPGDTFTADIEFLTPREALCHFPVGAKFEVWEGGVKASGVVTSR
jgi:hypothetical protein